LYGTIESNILVSGLKAGSSWSSGDNVAEDVSDESNSKLKWGVGVDINMHEDDESNWLVEGKLGEKLKFDINVEGQICRNSVTYVTVIALNYDACKHRYSRT
jgi:hypothetical protein